ncbi:MAG: hypothetical protein JST40_08735 [Armatimonadetes bacterium]|nr:hypothetical protein [Armatimonadota bacterium]
MQTFLSSIADVWHPHEGQREFLLRTEHVKVLACGRRWGKSEACAIAILHRLLGQERIEKILLIAPTLIQSQIIFERILELLPDITEEKPIVKRGPYPSIQLFGNVLRSRSGVIQRNLRGLGATLIVVDEAAFVPESVITDVALPMLATTNGDLILISTPHGRNHFWKFFMMGQSEGGKIWSKTAPSSENPNVTRAFLDNQKELVSERVFLVEYEASFLEDSTQVFPDESVTAAIRPIVVHAEAPTRIGIDWARYTDYTAVAVVQGTRSQANLVALHHWTGVGWTEQIDRVADIVAHFPEAKVTCDATGMGDVALEMLRKRLDENVVEGVVFTTRTKSDLVDGLAWMFENRALAILPHPELQKELSYYRAESKGSRTEFGGAGGVHDDLVTALALAVSALPRHEHVGIAVGCPRKFSHGTERRLLTY